LLPCKFVRQNARTYALDAYQDEIRKNVIFDLIFDFFFLKRGSNNVKRKNNEKLNKENKRLK
jgi:hypothetical protein